MTKISATPTRSPDTASPVNRNDLNDRTDRLRRLRETRRLVEQKLRRIGAVIRWQRLLEAVAEGCALGLLVAGALVLADWFFRFDRPVRLALLYVVGVSLVGLYGLRIFRQVLRARIRRNQVARMVDRAHPGFAEKVANVLELPSRLKDPAGWDSPAMIERAVLESARDVIAVRLAERWNWGRTVGYGILLVTSMIAVWSAVRFLPETMGLAFRRWILASNERWPQRHYIGLEGLEPNGIRQVPRGERFVLRIRGKAAGAPLGSQVSLAGRGETFTLPRSLFIARETPSQVILRLERPGRRAESIPLVRLDENHFTWEWEGLVEPLRATLIADDDWIGPFTLEPVDRPEVTSVVVIADWPVASSTANPDDPNEPSLVPGAGTEIVYLGQSDRPLAFLPETRLTLRGSANEPILEARLTRDSGAPELLALTGEHGFSGRWTLGEAAHYELRVRSARTGLESRPLPFSISVASDREPRVALRAVGLGPRITAVAQIPLTLQASDDYGLASVALEIDRILAADTEEAPSRQSLPIPLSPVSQLESKFTGPILETNDQRTIDLADSPPPVGSEIRLRGVATDHCRTGSQRGQSRDLVFGVVSEDELFYDILMRQRAERARFASLVEGVSRQQPALKEGAERAALETARRTIEQSLRTSSQIAARLGTTVTEMRLNRLGSEESHRLLEEMILQPLAQLDQPNQPGSRLREALATLERMGDPASRTRAQQEFTAYLDQLREILEQMAQWESFVDIINQVRAIRALQEQLLEQTERARKVDIEGLFDE